MPEKDGIGPGPYQVTSAFHMEHAARECLVLVLDLCGEEGPGLWELFTSLVYGLRCCWTVMQQDHGSEIFRRQAQAS